MLSKIFQAIFNVNGKVKVNGQEYTGKKFTLMIDDKVIETYTTYPKIDILENVVSIESVNGDIKAHKLVQGDIKTVNGDVTIDTAQGVGKISTVNGDVTIGRN